MTPLKCPHCGYDGDDFRVLDDLVCTNDIARIDRQAQTIHVADGSRIDWDSSNDERLECPNCLEDFYPPDGWTIDWSAT